MAEYGKHFDEKNPREAKSEEYQGSDDFRLKSLKITSPNDYELVSRSVFKLYDSRSYTS